jgi:hypothetical protein
MGRAKFAEAMANKPQEAIALRHPGKFHHYPQTTGLIHGYLGIQSLGHEVGIQPVGDRSAIPTLGLLQYRRLRQLIQVNGEWSRDPRGISYRICDCNMAIFLDLRWIWFLF